MMILIIGMLQSVCLVALVASMLFAVLAHRVSKNIAGGRAGVDVNLEDSHVILTVADTGIGIPPKHQARVFERFYRVDKSHSRETGGTGLGLSIVKHAAHYHNARINLQSRPGAGTMITVAF